MTHLTVYTIAGVIALGALGALFLILTARPPATLPNMLALHSDAFKDSGLIPPQYTCEGRGISPPLTIDGIPAGTKTLALIVDDPDVPKVLLPSGVYDHWVLFNLPAGGQTSLAIAEGETPAGATEGANSSGQTGYTPPCPPAQYEPAEHRYIFVLYALDGELGLPPGAAKDEVLAAMQGHILGQAQLVGRYRKAGK